MSDALASLASPFILTEDEIGLVEELSVQVDKCIEEFDLDWRLHLDFLKQRFPLMGAGSYRVVYKFREDLVLKIGQDNLREWENWKGMNTEQRALCTTPLFLSQNERILVSEKASPVSSFETNPIFWAAVSRARVVLCPYLWDVEIAAPWQWGTRENGSLVLLDYQF